MANATDVLVSMGVPNLQQIIIIGAKSSLSYTPPRSFDLSGDRLRDLATGFGIGESLPLEDTWGGAGLHSSRCG